MPRLASELLFESAAALRLVDHAIGELNPARGDAAASSTSAAPAEVEVILDQLRATRELLQHSSVVRLLQAQSQASETGSFSATAAADCIARLEEQLAHASSALRDVEVTLAHAVGVIQSRAPSGPDR